MIEPITGTFAMPGAVVDALAAEIAVRIIEHLTVVAMPSTVSSPYMSVPEAAEYLRCSRQRVDDLLSSRRLTRVKEGRRTLVRRSEIESYLREST